MKKRAQARFEIIASSCRPFAQNAEYAKLQTRAINTWLALGNRVVLFNAPEDCPGLAGVSFIKPDRDPPTVRFMIEQACNCVHDELASIVLVNSDIVLAPSTTGILESLLEIHRERTYAVTSRRYWLDLNIPLADAFSTAETRDLGLDFFLAPKRVWEFVLKDISHHLTLGRPLWDTWLAGWFYQRVGGNYYDATNRRLVFHPDHDRSEWDRLTNYTESEVASVKMVAFGMPDNNI